MIARLTATEQHLLDLLLAQPDLPRKGYAYRLEISEKTVSHHFQHLYEKTGTHTRVSLVAWAYQQMLRRAYGPLLEESA